jgi:hypothetical protein
MAMLLVTREIGTSLMFFGVFLALLYVATGRFSFPFSGCCCSPAGRITSARTSRTSTRA